MQSMPRTSYRKDLLMMKTAHNWQRASEAGTVIGIASSLGIVGLAITLLEIFRKRRGERRSSVHSCDANKTSKLNPLPATS